MRTTAEIAPGKKREGGEEADSEVEVKKRRGKGRGLE